MNDVRVSDNPQADRYELHVDGDLAGFIAYERRDDTVTLLYTTIEPEFEGRGLGGRLVSAVLDDLRNRDLEMVPVCPFVRSYLARHAQ